MAAARARTCKAGIDECFPESVPGKNASITGEELAVRRAAAGGEMHFFNAWEHRRHRTSG
jgi:hypothetical protein